MSARLLSACLLAVALSARAGPQLDHVIVVVKDLDTAAITYGALGFRMKPGTLHPNNLVNRHIKFRDGTEIELMALGGPPGDAMARGYAALLALRPGGAYAALKAENLESVAEAARRVGLVVRRSSSGPWHFLGFEGNEAPSIFFIAGYESPRDPVSLFSHENGADGLVEAWVEGGAKLEALLRELGAAPGGRTCAADRRCGNRWRLGDRDLVIVPPASAEAPARLLGVVLRKRDEAKARAFDLPAGFWVTFEPSPTTSIR